MAAQVDVYNHALLLLGANRVESVDNTTDTNVIRLNTLWETVRDRLVSAYNWSWAVSQATLVKSATTVLFGYDYAYALPSGFLRAVKLSSKADGFKWEIKGGLLQIDLNSDDGDDYAVELEYVGQVTDVTLFPASFCSALSYALASELSIIQKGAAGFSAAKFLLDRSTLYLQEAMKEDMQNQRVDDEMDSDGYSFVSARA